MWSGGFERGRVAPRRRHLERVLVECYLDGRLESSNVVSQQDFQLEFTFCSHVERGQGGMMECLEQSFDQLQPQCQKVVEHASKRRAAKEACQQDVQTYCADVQPGQGRVVKCLDQSYDMLSPRCQQVIDEARTRRQR